MSSTDADENRNIPLLHFEETIERILLELKKIRDVKAVYLFGSYATGRQMPFSDIDICVIAGKISERERSEISALGSEKVHVSIFDELPVYIRFSALKEGRQLFCRDEEFLHEIMFLTLKEYFSFQHILRRYKEAYGVRK